LPFLRLTSDFLTSDLCRNKRDTIFFITLLKTKCATSLMTSCGIKRSFPSKEMPRVLSFYLGIYESNACVSPDTTCDAKRHSDRSYRAPTPAHPVLPVLAGSLHLLLAIHWHLPACKALPEATHSIHPRGIVGETMHYATAYLYQTQKKNAQTAQEEEEEEGGQALKNSYCMDRLVFEHRLEKTHALIAATRAEEDEFGRQQQGETAGQKIGGTARRICSTVSKGGRKLLNKLLSMHKFRVPDDGGGHVHFRLPSAGGGKGGEDDDGDGDRDWVFDQQQAARLQITSPRGWAPRDQCHDHRGFAMPTHAHHGLPGAGRRM
jgi:hypothetical protein